jgi:5,10-methylenetetrahydrofolate reductase
MASVTLRFSEQELSQLQKQADLVGVSLEDWIQRRMAEQPDGNILDKPLAEILKRDEFLVALRRTPQVFGYDVPQLSPEMFDRGLNNERD